MTRSLPFRSFADGPDRSPGSWPTTATAQRAAQLSDEVRHRILVRTDRMFAGLLVFEWILGIGIAFVISPRTWNGDRDRLHLHVVAAVGLGGLMALFPAFLAWTRSGEPLTRHVVAVGQLLMSALFIHLNGGRIETHFRVFGSLAFLSFYRDGSVLLTATATMFIDHTMRGYLWPQSVYGMLTASPWHALEHVAWVLFEVVFLLQAVRRGIEEMHRLSQRQAELEAVNTELHQARAAVEVRVQEALDSVKQLQGLLPICTSCKNIRDDHGYWREVEVYLRENSEADFTHSLCPSCIKAQYPETYERMRARGEVC